MLAGETVPDGVHSINDSWQGGLAGTLHTCGGRACRSSLNRNTLSK